MPETSPNTYCLIVSFFLYRGNGHWLLLMYKYLYSFISFTEVHSSRRKFLSLLTPVAFLSLSYSLHVLSIILFLSTATFDLSLTCDRLLTSRHQHIHIPSRTTAGSADFPRGYVARSADGPELAVSPPRRPASALERRSVPTQVSLSPASPGHKSAWTTTEDLTRPAAAAAAAAAGPPPIRLLPGRTGVESTPMPRRVLSPLEPTATLAADDPAVPLIRAIQAELKRFGQTVPTDDTDVWAVLRDCWMAGMNWQCSYTNWNIWMHLRQKIGVVPQADKRQTSGTAGKFHILCTSYETTFNDMNTTPGRVRRTIETRTFWYSGTEQSVLSHGHRYGTF